MAVRTPVALEPKRSADGGVKSNCELMVDVACNKPPLLVFSNSELAGPASHCEPIVVEAVITPVALPVRIEVAGTLM